MSRNAAHFPLLDKLAKRAGFAMTRQEALISHCCARCSKPVGRRYSFRDDISWREYGISALCQRCQDDLDEQMA